jgi:hypothetical protein
VLSDRIGSILATVATAVVVFWLAFDDATFGLVARSSLAIALWWVIGLGVALGLLQLPSRRAFWGVAALLAAFAGWTGASMIWAASNERAFNELNRVSLYLAVFIVAGLLARYAAPSRWADGVALGIVGVAGLALAQRFFPDVFPRGELGRYSEGPQLSYPLEYVNGLGIFLALSLPLLLRAAVASPTSLGRAAALAPFPAVSAAIYLTSSRGAVIVATTGIVAFLALTPLRWATAGALGVALTGSAGAIAVLLARPAIVDEPLSRAAETQGPWAALLLAVLCVGTGLAYAAGGLLLRGRTPKPALGWATVVVALVLGVTGVAAADPAETFDTFRKVPTAPGAQANDYTVRGHLLSANSTGRWQFWKAAAEQFEAHPVVGDGAGSYEAWWAQHGSFTMFITDAHSLYLETLGELGIVGLALLLAPFVLGGAAAIQRTREAADPFRTACAALTACFIAYGVAAALDWMWELTIVAVVGLAALAWVLGSDTDRAGGLVVRLLVPAVALIAIACQAIPLTANLAIRDSQAAVRRDDLAEARDRAHAARDVQRWAASPHLQLALVLEQIGDLPGARQSIGDAINRDPRDWRLWLVRARLETEAGAIALARRSIRRAAELNPRSPIFASG